MALGKLLKLGGIDNRSPKTDQSVGRFRVARNVMPTNDGRLIPRGSEKSIPGQSANIKCVHAISEYDGDVISWVSEDFGGGVGNEQHAFYRGTSLIPRMSDLGVSIFSTNTSDYSQSAKIFRNNNTAYIQDGFAPGLYKYDGVEVGAAGCPFPRYSVDVADVGGTRWLRYVQHTMDFDNNEPVSGDAPFATGGAGATNIQVSGISPIGFVLNDAPLEGLTDYNFFTGTTVWSNANNDFTVTATETNLTTAQHVGSYVFVAVTQSTADAMLPTLAAVNTISYGLALKIKSISPLKLDGNDAYRMNSTRVWEKYNLTDTDGNAADGLITWGTRTFLTAWESLSENGIYYYRNIYPSFPISTNSSASAPYRTSTATTGSATASTGYDTTMFTIGPILNDWFDVTSIKISPFDPRLINDYQTYCMTEFQDLLLLANDDNIHFSDPSLGGWYEQFSTSSFLKIGGKEYGRITSICGTQDALFVGRERKNYLVTGNIATGNYRVQEVAEAEIGPWSNVSSIEIKGKIIFITALGVYELRTGGACVKISELCPKNFDSYDLSSVNEDVVFRLTGTCANIDSDNDEDDGLSIAFDEYRDLLVFMKKGAAADTNPCLVLHVKSGEFYEWEGLHYNPDFEYLNCISFIDGSFYIGEISADGIYGAEIWTEQKDPALVSLDDFRPELYTTWLTAGEPSLEKQLLQLKMFGRVNTNGSTTTGLYVSHYKDFDKTTPIVAGYYIPAGDQAIQFSHKKRLTSDKVLAASVGFEAPGGIYFELESFEVEFEPIQEGVKR